MAHPNSMSNLSLSQSRERNTLVSSARSATCSAELGQDTALAWLPAACQQLPAACDKHTCTCRRFLPSQ